MTTPLSSPDSQPGRETAWIPGGTFLMGSDHHYPEEAPAHQVTVGTSHLVIRCIIRT
jgi:formylglycine-generating enzyme